MNEAMGDGADRQEDSHANLSVLVELLAVQRRIALLQEEGAKAGAQVVSLMARVAESQDRGSVAIERILAFVSAAAGKPAAPTKPKKVYRTPAEVSRIVADAIAMVQQFGWSDSRIAREMGVPRSVFMKRKPYVDARLKADAYFSRVDPDTDLEQ
jgi:hypothetical protein